MPAGRRRRCATSSGSWPPRRDFRLLLTTFVLQALAIGCMLAGVDYVAGDVLGRTGAATILFVCFVGPALLLTPLWARIGSRVGKKRGYVAASLVLAAGARRCWWPRRSRPTAVVFAATGADRRRATPAPRSSRWRCCRTPRPPTPGRTGENRAGVFTGVWTAGETLGLALGPGLFALVLALGGYRLVDRR